MHSKYFIMIIFRKGLPYAWVINWIWLSTLRKENKQMKIIKERSLQKLDLMILKDRSVDVKISSGTLHIQSSIPFPHLPVPSCQALTIRLFQDQKLLLFLFSYHFSFSYPWFWKSVLMNKKRPPTAVSHLYANNTYPKSATDQMYVFFMSPYTPYEFIHKKSAVLLT